VPLLPVPVYQTLDGASFVQEFASYEQAYLGLARLVAQNVIDTLKQANIPFSLNPQEDFADQHLVDKLTIWLLADVPFQYFRQALRRGRRKYIDPVDYWAWGEMMARYVLSQRSN